MSYLSATMMLTSLCSFLHHFSQSDPTQEALYTHSIHTEHGASKFYTSWVYKPLLARSKQSSIYLVYMPRPLSLYDWSQSILYLCMQYCLLYGTNIILQYSSSYTVKRYFPRFSDRLVLLQTYLFLGQCIGTELIENTHTICLMITQQLSTRQGHLC